MSDPVTISVYDRRAQEYARLTGTEAPDRTLAAFISGLAPGGRVLDLGCGPGAAAGHMAQFGLKAEAWDPSEAMVALAGAQEGVIARQASFDDLAGLDPDSFDGIWANFSLLHAPRAAMPRHLAAIAAALRPRGMFHIAVKEGEGSKRDNLGRLYTYFTQNELKELLRQAGLMPGPFQQGEDIGLDGAMARWISVTAYG